MTDRQYEYEEGCREKLISFYNTICNQIEEIDTCLINESYPKEDKKLIEKQRLLTIEDKESCMERIGYLVDLESSIETLTNRVGSSSIHYHSINTLYKETSDICKSFNMSEVIDSYRDYYSNTKARAIESFYKQGD